ncbi:MAG: YggS family pyridoxal phosphate-dependent enzyme [Dehalococcoidia bacterium]
MTIEENLEEIGARISKACERSGRSLDEVTLAAITKTQNSEAIRAAFEAGIRHFGENRVQEAGGKLPELKEIRSQSTWHMVGHLQTNKVKTALELFDIIQSVDSLKLAASLSRNAHGDVPVFLQVNLAGEETKSGFSIEELAEAASRIEASPARAASPPGRRAVPAPTQGTRPRRRRVT